MYDLASGGPITNGDDDTIAVGSAVLAHMPLTGPGGGGRERKRAIVTAASDDGEKLELLFVEDGCVHTVAAATVTLQPPTVPRLAPASTAERPPEYALALVDAAMTRPADVMRRVDPATGVVPVAAGAAFLTP